MNESSQFKTETPLPSVQLYRSFLKGFATVALETWRAFKVTIAWFCKKAIPVLKFIAQKWDEAGQRHNEMSRIRDEQKNNYGIHIRGLL